MKNVKEIYASLPKNVKTAVVLIATLGFTATACYFSYQYGIKPVVAKIKAKKETDKKTDDIKTK